MEFTDNEKLMLQALRDAADGTGWAGVTLDNAFCEVPFIKKSQRAGILSSLAKKGVYRDETELPSYKGYFGYVLKEVA